MPTSRSIISLGAGASGLSPVSNIGIPSFFISFSRNPNNRTKIWFTYITWMFKTKQYIYFSNSSSIYPFLHPLYKKKFNQSVVRLISVLHWLKSDYLVEFSCFPLNFLLWRHEKRWQCLMTLHRMNTSFCWSFEKKE